MSASSKAFCSGTSFPVWSRFTKLFGESEVVSELNDPDDTSSTAWGDTTKGAVVCLVNFVGSGYWTASVAVTKGGVTCLVSGLGIGIKSSSILKANWSGLSGARQYFSWGLAKLVLFLSLFRALIRCESPLELFRTSNFVLVGVFNGSFMLVPDWPSANSNGAQGTTKFEYREDPGIRDPKIAHFRKLALYGGEAQIYELNVAFSASVACSMIKVLVVCQSYFEEIRWRDESNDSFKASIFSWQWYWGI